MTLFRQMALMLSTFLFFILTIVLILNFQSTKKSVKDRLYDDAKNTASSLSLSLGNANGDIVVMSTMINANFDSGNYNKVSLVDVDGSMLYERKTEVQQKSVPKWFLELIDVKAPVAFANVSAGWSQVGILEVVGDATYAHKQLYSTFIELILLFILVAIIGLLVLNYLIHIMLKPLKEIQKQAAAISRNEFIIQNNTPYITEFRDVVSGMNNMVIKVKAMFDKGNKELKALKEQEYIDSQSGLKNKKYFIDKLPHYLKMDASYTGGVNILIHIDGIIEANDKIGRVNVNNMFMEFIDIFKKKIVSINEAMLIRMGGVEFNLFLPNVSLDTALNITKDLQQTSYDIIKKYDLDTTNTYLIFGLYEYSFKNSAGEFLSACDDALSQAKFYENKIFAQKAKESNEIMGRDEWRKAIQNSIENDKFEFVFWNVFDTKNQKELHKIISLKLNLDKDRTFAYAQFISHTIQAGLSFSLYKYLLNNIFIEHKLPSKGVTYSFRLSKEFLENKEAYTYLQNLFRVSHKKYNITIELPDGFLREDSKYTREIIELFRSHSIEIGVFEFIGEGSDYEYIQHIRPQYIKAESKYILTQSKESLDALKLIAESIGIALIAISVNDIEDVSKLQERDIYKIQGYATELF